MSRKRTTLMPDIYQNKKHCASETSSGPIVRSASECAGCDNHVHHTNGEASQSHTRNALMELRNLFPREKFMGRLPAIVLRHQLYSFVKSEITVKGDLECMQSRKEVHLFQLGRTEEDVVVLMMDDYRSHVCIHAAHLGLSLLTANKFLSNVVSQNPEMCLKKEALSSTYKFQTEEISELMRLSVLRERDKDSWWLAIPGQTIFRKAYLRGRKAVMTMMNKSKNKECYRKDLESRKLHKIAKLGMKYHVCDIIGAKLVTCMDTPAGQLMRLALV